MYPTCSLVDPDSEQPMMELLNPEQVGCRVFLFSRRARMPKEEDWKRRLAELLREHPDIGNDFTGKVEINMNQGGITRIFANKELK